MRKTRAGDQQRDARGTPRRAGGEPHDASPASSLVLHASLSAYAKNQLLALMAGGARSFVLASSDGSMSIRMTIERAEAHATTSFRYGRLAVDWPRGTVSTSSGRAILSPTELRLLGALLEAGHEVVTREELCRRVWPDASSHERSCASLPVYIHMLRRRLACIGAASVLKTERGVGYRLEL